MAIDASGVLGAPQLAGVKVNLPGYAWRLARNQSGNLAGRIVLGSQPHSGQAGTPPFGRLAFLAVTKQELAIPAGWHDYRIWALKARRLLLIL